MKFLNFLLKKSAVDAIENVTIKTLNTVDNIAKHEGNVTVNFKSGNIRAKTVNVGENSTGVPTKIAVLNSSSHYQNQNYAAVKNEFLACGFINVSLLPKNDLIKGWVVKDGSVESVAINGKTSFRKKARFPKNSQVVIIYHTFKK